MHVANYIFITTRLDYNCNTASLMENTCFRHRQIFGSSCNGLNQKHVSRFRFFAHMDDRTVFTCFTFFRLSFFEVFRVCAKADKDTSDQEHI